MRRVIALAALAIGAAAPFVPLTTASACYDLGKPVGCLPSECLLVASVISTANHAAGDPLGDFPNCVD